MDSVGTDQSGTDKSGREPKNYAWTMLAGVHDAAVSKCSRVQLHLATHRLLWITGRKQPTLCLYGGLGKPTTQLMRVMLLHLTLENK
eukprot:1209232-Lingulodinium_polyedra.AAC.1